MTAQPKRKHVAKYGLRRKSAKFMRAGQGDTVNDVVVATCKSNGLGSPREQSLADFLDDLGKRLPNYEGQVMWSVDDKAEEQKLKKLAQEVRR